MAINPDYITTNEGAELTGWHQSYVIRLVRQKRIRGEKVGYQWFVHKPDLLAFKAHQDALGPAKHARRDN